MRSFGAGLPTGSFSLSLANILLMFQISVVLSSPALIIIDVQNCFTGNGSLSVREGENVIPVINRIRSEFGSYLKAVVLTQDWHCVNHVSFASQYPNYELYDYDTIDLTYLDTGELCEKETVIANYAINCNGLESRTTVLKQRLWPDHCVMDTKDADFHSELIHEKSDIVVRKGYHCQIDSYSGFYDNGDFTHTEMHQLLSELGIKTVFITGLVMDFCVFATAKDAVKLGYETYVVSDATGHIDKSNAESAIKTMTDQGVIFVNSTDLGKIFTSGANKGILSHFILGLLLCFSQIIH